MLTTSRVVDFAEMLMPDWRQSVSNRAFSSGGRLPISAMALQGIRFRLAVSVR